MPVEPPADPVGVPACRLRRRRPDRDRGRPRPRHGAARPTGTGCSRWRSTSRSVRRSPEMAWWSPEPRGVLPLSGLRVTRSMRQSARQFEIRVDTAFAEVVAGCADPGRSGGWIDDADRDGVHRAAPTRLGPLRRGLARRRARGWAVRRRRRRPVRRRVDVHPRARRLEGRADGAGRPALRRVRRPAGSSTPSGRPPTSRRSASSRSRAASTSSAAPSSAPLRPTRPR